MKKIKIAGFVLLASLLAVSCLPENQSIGSAGKTFINITPDSYNMVAFDAKAVPQSGILFEVRKVVSNEADMNTPSTVVLNYDTDGSIMAAYNSANKTTYIPLPTSLGTTSPAVTSGTITLNFGAGEFAKIVTINVPNAGNFDFSKSYALAFKLSSVSGVGTLSAAVGKTVVCEVLAKNKYDGIYMMKGFIMRPGDTGGLEGYFTDHKKFMTTAGASSISMAPNQLWANATGVGGIGTWTITVNETNNKITVTDPIAVRWLMDPTYPNRYDPVKKAFYFKVNWGAADPYNRGCVDTLVYVGPR
ncbi:MAG: DUF1735 domain-containing protein [Prolixibacteraceae bacterium]